MAGVGCAGCVGAKALPDGAAIAVAGGAAGNADPGAGGIAAVAAAGGAG